MSHIPPTEGLGQRGAFRGEPQEVMRFPEGVNVAGARGAEIAFHVLVNS